MRELGAAGRYVLEHAAAKKWGVDPSEVYAKDHRLYHTGTGRWFDFGEVVGAAADIVVPTGDAAPKLKDESQWKYIGRDMPVVDNYDMSTGGATYGADISVPGMKIAVVARPAGLPRQGEVVRRQRGAQSSGRRAGHRDSGVCPTTSRPSSTRWAASR